MAHKSVTLGDIARETGLTRASVSRALAGNPRISLASRERVLAVAERLGYRPDPEVRRLMAHLRTTREVRFVGTLGLINDAPKGQDLYRDPYTASVISGAKKRAEELGYTLDEIKIRQQELTASRLAVIFRSRMIQGVLIPPQADLNQKLDLPFDDIVVVAATAARPEIPLHRVSPDHFENSLIIFNQLLELGYKRVGLFTTEEMENRQHHAPSCVYHWHVHQQKNFEPIPPLDVIREVNAIAPWFKQYQPEVIVAPDSWVKTIFDTQVGGKAKVAFVLYGNKRAKFAGIDELPEVVGSTAIEFLTASITRGEKGTPMHPKRVLVEGKFLKGASLAP